MLSKKVGIFTVTYSNMRKSHPKLNYNIGDLSEKISNMTSVSYLKNVG